MQFYVLILCPPRSICSAAPSFFPEGLRYAAALQVVELFSLLFCRKSVGALIAGSGVRAWVSFFSSSTQAWQAPPLLGRKENKTCLLFQSLSLPTLARTTCFAFLVLTVEWYVVVAWVSSQTMSWLNDSLSQSLCVCVSLSLSLSFSLALSC